MEPVPFLPFGKRSEVVSVTNHKKHVWVKTWALLLDGTLMGGCRQVCKHKFVPMEQFAPNADAEQSAGNAQRFAAALVAFRAAHAACDLSEAEKQLKIIKKLRRNECSTCRGRYKPAPENQACMDEWAKMRWNACQKQSGCANPDCSERGMATWIALQFDHLDPAPENHRLSDCNWWACNGGIAAMRSEHAKPHQWICGACHNLEETSKSGRRVSTIAPERRNGETNKQYNSRSGKARIIVPKMLFVDDEKLKVGCCQYPGCGRVVTAANTVSFDWDHRVHSTKRVCQCEKGIECSCENKIFGRTLANGGIGGGVTGLVQNHSKAAALDVPGVKELLLEELQKCDLMCRPCHFSRKPKGRARWDESPPECVKCDHR
tara:strand:- start:73 stop:1200 length:1128 start_codon:yes stop_codon:yes gene_type:complete